MSIFCSVLILLISQVFEIILYVFWLNLFNWSAVQLEFFIQFFEYYFRTCPAMFFLFRRHDFCYDHMTSVTFCSLVHAISTELHV